MIKANKRYGQNFLQDIKVIELICKHVDPNHPILEIGPGTGALTYCLAEFNPCNMSVVEIDGRLIPQLSKDNRFKVIHADILDLDINQLISVPAQIIGNLPYNIGAKILMKLIQAFHNILSIGVMLQLEVARSIVNHTSRLGAVLHFYFEVTELCTVSPKCFTPQPKVWSTFIILKPRSEALEHLHLASAHHKVVTLSYSKRRKQLINNLSSIIDMNHPYAHLRAEQLTRDQFIELAILYHGTL